VVNKKLAEIDGYAGHVEDIDIWLIRGAYQIREIKLEKTGGEIPVPFYSADIIDLSVEWKSLFKGRIVGEIVMIQPKLNYVKGPTEATTQTKIDKDWTEVVDELMPLKINRFEITRGEVHFMNFHSSPEVDIYMDSIYVVASNLTNVNREEERLPSTVFASANIYDGTMVMNMKLDPLNSVPTFDLNAELSSVDLTNLNEFLKAYGKFDVQKGTIGIYTEAAAKEGKISGYTKPVIKDLDVVSWEREEDSFGKKVWESIVELAASIFKNHPRDQLATEVEFEGDLTDPEISIWDIIGETLRNAFIQALYPSLENSISIASVEKEDMDDKGFLKSIFKNEEKKEGKDEERQEDDKEKEKEKENEKKKDKAK
jgi:hypothetical protein